MDARQTRLLLAAAIVAASAMTASCSRPTAPPVGQPQDAQGAGDADVDAGASADASADADTGADTSADASTIDASTRGGPHGDGGSDTAGTADGGATRSRVVKIDEASGGKTIELAPGQSLVAMLTANPSTGFDWSVIKAPAALGAPDMGFVAGGEQPGAPGKRRITWTVKSALPAGEQAVELGYARSFEKGVAPFKTFKFKVRAAR